MPVRVQAIVSDECGPATWGIISVSSSEPEDGRGSRHTAPDSQIISNDTLLLRAERSGNGNGRVYTITVQANDLSGNASQEIVTIPVLQSEARRRTKKKL